MKISLCKHSKDVEKTAKFLERNLRKVDIEIKGCIGQCDDCAHNAVAKIDGKDIMAKDAYGLLKEIRKILKKKDKLDLLDEAAMKAMKLEMKGKDKDKDKDKDKAKAKEKEKGKDKKKDSDLNRAVTEQDSPDSISDQAEPAAAVEPIEARIVGDQVILTVPNEQFSLDNMQISLNVGTFGGQNSTYEVRKVEKTPDERIQEQEKARDAEKATIMTFSVPDPLSDPN